MALKYGNQDHHISLDNAKRYTKNYRDNPPGPKVKGGSFDRTILDEILAQPGCAGIRCYYAIKDDGAPTLVIAGITADGEDLYNGVLAEEWFPCPPFCWVTSPLNS